MYSEGFLAPEPSSPDGFFDRSAPFISIDELINHETLDPHMISIPDYVKLAISGGIELDKITPLMLADYSERDSRLALELVASLRSKVDANSGALISELDDVATWSRLGVYFADKIRAGVALESFRNTGDQTQKQQAIKLLEKCVAHWDEVVALTKDRYMPTPLVSTQRYPEEYHKFSWERLRPQVVRDVEIAKIADFNK